MRAKFVLYESIDFERGLEPKQALSLGRRALIKKWFDDLGYGLEKYTINADLSIKVKGSLDLRRTQIISLPDNLNVEGYLDLAGTKITSLPDNLNVEGSLWLNRTNITSLPDNLNVGGDLHLEGTKITSLPDNLSVGRTIYKNF